jgi:hypothetical protein
MQVGQDGVVEKRQQQLGRQAMGDLTPAAMIEKYFVVGHPFFLVSLSVPRIGGG